MATYTYKGTKVKGTGEGGVATPNVRRNDTYLNTQTGHVYVCVEAHPTWAVWRYIRTDIIAKPDQSVYGLGAPVRGSNGSRTMSTKWATSDWQKNTQNGKRMTSIYRVWQVNTWINQKHYPLKDAKEIGVNATESAINLNNLKIGNNTYDRSSFYPLTKRFLTSVACTVYTKNAKGYGTKVAVSRSFDKPRTPVIAAPTFNAENGHLTFRITTDAGIDYRERYDTRYKLTAKKASTKVTTVVSDSFSTSTDFTVSYDAVDYMQMSYDDYIEVKCEAWARGYKGDSAHATRTYYISYPAQASITGTDISSEDSTGKCTVFIKTNKNVEHPVDGVKLEYLANVDYARASDIPGNADWEDTGIVDDADCTALSVAVTELIPEKGKYTWLRVKSWHAAEGRLYRYSKYKDVMHKEAPTAEDDKIVILSAEPASGGKSAAVQLAWNADGQDDSTGTEISWSTELDTWESTSAPDVYMFEWDQGEITSGGVTYHSSARIIIKGLKEGERYYVKARRYLDGDVTTYSEYSDYATFITSEIPESIVAICDSFIAKGSPLPVYWTFSGNGIQTRWQIESYVNGADENVVLADGEGSTGFAQIGVERLEEHAVNNTLTIRVGASTGSNFVWSEWKTVSIVSAPTLTIDVDDALTAQPMSFDVTVSSPSRLLVIVSSEGATSQFPTGRLTQTYGDTIHSGVYDPEWSESEGLFTATVTLPTDLDFWKLGDYKLSVVATDTVTGLSSETSEHIFSIDWTHEAVSPFTDDSHKYVDVAPIDEVDDEGTHRKAVQIDLTPPIGSAESDVYDIYRLSADGAQLIGEGFPLTYTTVDEFAPFGEDLTLYYRVALRTVDGDVDFADFEYSADGDYLRFDWDGYYFESPYSVAVSDSYDKSVDIRQHMDGNSSGYWNSNVRKKSSLSTDVIRIIQPTEADLARQLGRYAGTVFVRTPAGEAYEADVQVTELSSKNRAVYSIAFDAIEVGLTAEFMLPIPEVEEEEEP